MRILWSLVVVVLTGCFADEPTVCDDPAIDRCETLWPHAEASFTIDDTTVMTLDFREPDAERPRTLRLTCETNGALDDCIKSWVMPDLDRLPHTEARLLGIENPVGATRGKFRIDDVVLLTDDESYRVTGSVEGLRFDTEDEVLVFADGDFDVAVREVQ